MGRRRKNISGLPIRGFDQTIRNTFSATFNLLASAGWLIGQSINRKFSQSEYYGYSDIKTYPTSNTYDIRKNKPKLKKSQFKAEIDEIELAIENKTASVKQCEYLASIYSKIGDYCEERYARIMALGSFLRLHNLSHLFPIIVDAFNNPCKKPQESICENDEVNKEYRRLLNNAELAKRRSYKIR